MQNSLESVSNSLFICVEKKKKKSRVPADSLQGVLTQFSRERETKSSICSVCRCLLLWFFFFLQEGGLLSTAAATVKRIGREREGVKSLVVLSSYFTA